MPRHFSRLSESQLIDFINDNNEHKDVLIISGARQVGKSTLLREILSDKPALFLNLEKSPSWAVAIDRCADFAEFETWLKANFQFDPEKRILAIDEAQQSAKLGSFVRFMKEEWPRATVILTGSTINELHRETGRRPVGRESFLDLWPLSFKEFLLALDQDALGETLNSFNLGDGITPLTHELIMEKFGEYLRVGGLPEVVAYYKRGRDYAKRRADIYKTYEDDFIRYFSLEEVNLFRRCLEAVAANAASPSKDTQVVRLDGPGYKKVAGIFARLEKWKLIIKCEQTGLKPENNKFHPKRYLHDVGMLSEWRLKGLTNIRLTDLGEPALRTPLGGIIENAVAAALKTLSGDELIGMKLSTQSEIDFILKRDGKSFPVECKASLRFKENYLSNIVTYLKLASPDGTGFLLYGGPPLPENKRGVWVLPYYLTEETGRLAASVGARFRGYRYRCHQPDKPIGAG